MMDMVADLRAAKAAREARAQMLADVASIRNEVQTEQDKAVEADPIRNLEECADRELGGKRGLFRASW